VEMNRVSGGAMCISLMLIPSRIRTKPFIPRILL
jgi:hypothetical protein